MPTALITGASMGLGLALADTLADQPDPWNLIITARGADRLETARAHLSNRTTVTSLPGDVTDPDHRQLLAGVIPEDGLDMLVNNASDLGPSPLQDVARIDTTRLLDLFGTNVVAPVGLFQVCRAALEARHGTVVNISSDAASGNWEGWGPYGSTKAALDQISGVLATEHPDLRIYAFDPGDMHTDMHQAAFPGEDISDRPSPATIPPILLALLARQAPSGRYRASDVTAEVAA